MKDVVLTKDEVRNIINEAVYQSKLNYFIDLGEPKKAMWQNPLIGFAAGNDPLFSRYKRDIGEFFWSPSEAFALKMADGYAKSGQPTEGQLTGKQPSEGKPTDKQLTGKQPSDGKPTDKQSIGKQPSDGKPTDKQSIGKQQASDLPTDEELTVVSFILPQIQETKVENSKQADCPSPHWYVSRGTWEPMIADINDHIVNKLGEAGVQAVAIDAVPGFSRMQSEKFGLASKWSHRHAAFIAGLGTFGLSDGLITEKGKAIRISTIIMRHLIEADKRPYDSYNEYCLFYKDGSCRACIARCPICAITEKGHDKDACNKYLNEVIKQKMTEEGFNPGYIASCGLCQTNVPCQDGIPG